MNDIGRSAHQRFQGGGTAVPKFSQIPLHWSQVRSMSLRKAYQSLRRQLLSRSLSPPLFIAPLKGIPGGRAPFSRPIISANFSTFSGWSIESTRSAAHQSLLYAEGTSSLLFSKNSPNPIRISPLSHMEITSFLIASHSSNEEIIRYSPSANRTVGPSMSMQGVTAQAFPGLSIFICVPTEMKPPAASIEIGFIPAAARPVARLRPYLSLKPPGSPGSPKIGLPAITSSM